jgi:hypothetical protein
MTKTLKEVRQDLQEAVEASKTDLQYIRAKTARNDHFETRRYIAAEILRDKKLADAYKALEIIHDTYGSIIGNDAITIKTKIRKNDD